MGKERGGITLGLVYMAGVYILWMYRTLVLPRKSPQTLR
jgi:hypothetical protein